MTSYQKLKAKCLKLENDIEIFKNAITVYSTSPETEFDDSGSISFSFKMSYYIKRNPIDEAKKRELMRWIVENLDEETVLRLLEMKKEWSKK